MTAIQYDLDRMRAAPQPHSLLLGIRRLAARCSDDGYRYPPYWEAVQRHLPLDRDVVHMLWVLWTVPSWNFAWDRFASPAGTSSITSPTTSSG